MPCGLHDYSPPFASEPPCLTNCIGIEKIGNIGYGIDVQEDSRRVVLLATAQEGLSFCFSSLINQFLTFTIMTTPHNSYEKSTEVAHILDGFEAAVIDYTDGKTKFSHDADIMSINTHLSISGLADLINLFAKPMSQLEKRKSIAKANRFLKRFDKKVKLSLGDNELILKGEEKDIQSLIAFVEKLLRLTE